MMLALALSLLAGIAVVITGPACDDWRRKRRESRDFPAARVTFLLPSTVEDR